VPAGTCTHGKIRNNHREVIPCICGTDLVVVAKFRAAAVPKLVCGWPPSPKPGSSESAITDPPDLLLAVPNSRSLAQKQMSLRSKRSRVYGSLGLMPSAAMAPCALFNTARPDPENRYRIQLARASSDEGSKAPSKKRTTKKS
jgi:hypothetical protein